MKLKSILCLALSIIFVLGLAACNKNELKVDGGDMYYYSSSETPSSDTQNSSSDITIIDYTSTVSKSRPATDWESVLDGSEPYYFYIKNSMNVDISQVGYRPSGYKDYIMFDISIDVGESKPVEFSDADTVKYETFEFVFISDEDNKAELNPLFVKGQKGIELLYLNGGYSYEYLK